MENEEVKVVDQPKTEEKPAEEKKVEAPAKAAPKKRGPKAKSAAKKPVKKTAVKKEADAEVKKDDVKAPAKRGPKKAAKTTAKTATKAVPETKFDFAKTTFEYDGKKFTAESINAKVLEYLNKHPYISANVIETFVNIGEKKIYFTVDGFGNADFSIDL